MGNLYLRPAINSLRDFLALSGENSSKTPIESVRIIVFWKLPDHDAGLTFCQPYSRESQFALFFDEGQVASKIYPVSLMFITGKVPVLTTIRSWKKTGNFQGVEIKLK